MFSEVAAGIGAGTSEASKADSPTATAGSRAAQRENHTILYMHRLVLLFEEKLVVIQACFGVHTLLDALGVAMYVNVEVFV